MEKIEQLVATGFWGMMGVALAAAAAFAIIRLIMLVVDEFSNSENKAKAVLDNREYYLKKEMYEELGYIKKYMTQLEKGEWPFEMNRKFEYMETKEKGWRLEETEDGLMLKAPKRLLKLKDKFKTKNKTKDEVETPKDDTPENKQDDNKDNDKK